MHPNFVCSKEIDSATYVGLKTKKHEDGAHLAGAGAITKLDTSSGQKCDVKNLEPKYANTSKLITLAKAYSLQAPELEPGSIPQMCQNYLFEGIKQ